MNFGHYFVPIEQLLAQCKDDVEQQGIMLYCAAACGWASLENGGWLVRGVN